MATAKRKPMKRTKKPTASEQFLSMRLTRQTVYWSILCLLVLGLAMWVLQLTMQIQSIYNRVEYLNATNDTGIQTKQQ